MQTNFWKMSFHSGSKQNMADGTSRNLNFDEAQANNTIVSKKDVCGFEQISEDLLLQIQDKRSKRSKFTSIFTTAARLLRYLKLKF